MVQGRIEMSSAEQLVELRKARDRYKALADRFREEGDALASRFESEGDPLIVMQEKLRHERDARRIANAYEKSIANIEARSSLMQQAQRSSRGARNIGTGLAVLAFFLVAAVAIALVAGNPGLYRQGLAYLAGYWGGSNAVPAPASPSPSIGPMDAAPPIAPAPPADARQNPVAAKPAPAAVPAKKRAARVPAERGSKPAASAEEEGDFVAKVLQPDGTLKEQKFSARPRR